MFENRAGLPATFILLATATASPAAFADGDDHRPCRVSGAWLTTVAFPPGPPGAPPGPPPFKSLITFHDGGTVSETNTTLHANSANPMLDFNGSEGYGRWKRVHGSCALEYVTLKLVFDGTSNQHVGYLRVRARLTIAGHEISGVPEDSSVDLLLGLDPDAPLAVLPFGGSFVNGNRVR